MALQKILKTVLLGSLIVLAFAPAYSLIALDIYGGMYVCMMLSRGRQYWPGKLLSGGEGPVLFNAFMVYLPLLAINGMTECFTSAVRPFTMYCIVLHVRMSSHCNLPRP